MFGRVLSSVVLLILTKDKTGWPRCLLWHGWLPALSGSALGDPWAVDGVQIVLQKIGWKLHLALMLMLSRHPFDDFYLGDRDSDIVDDPFVWSDGSLVVDKVSGFGVAGAGVYAHVSGESWFDRRWAHLDLLPPLPDGGGERCRMYCSIPCPLQSVQRAVIWGVLVALQGRAVMRIGVGNLNVVNHVSSLIANRWSCKPFPSGQ